MSRLLFCLLGLSATFFVSTAEARLEGEGIVGGDYAKEGEYPYQVSLERDGESTCGGSIFSDRFVITAAHCVVDDDGRFFANPTRVVAGITDLNSRSRYRVAVDVAQVFVLKEFNAYAERPTADIAVLKLANDLGISSNPNLGRIWLPDDRTTYAGVKAVVSGFGLNKMNVVRHPLFGATEAGGMGFDKMRFAEADVVTNAACGRSYADRIRPQHLCAAVVQRSRRLPEGVCSGDSGGPLAYGGALIGIVSTSPLGCREDSKPALYTRVSKYVDFVKDVVSGNLNSDMRSIILRSRSIYG